MYGYGHPWGGGGTMGYGGLWWGHAFAWLFTLLLLALIVLALAGFVHWMIGGRAAGPRANIALEILRARYARGEVERAEFAQKKKDLER
jgi:putative membrane protein